MLFSLANDATVVGVADDAIVIPAAGTVIIICAAYEATSYVTSKVYDAVSSRVQKENERVWVTYTLDGPDGKIYIGRASGFGTPQQVLNRRFASHHMKDYGYDSPILDKFAIGARGSAAYAAIRGREQQMIDHLGGVGSTNVGNRIRGVRKNHPLGRTYHIKSNQMFGPLHQYTGY